MRRLLAMTCTAVMLAVPAAASAEPVVATNGMSLTRFDTTTLGTTTTVPVTGMQGGETLVGIDQRPATGQLYGVGSSSRLYLLDPITGVATQVGNPGAFTLSGTGFGTDFNPVADRIRQVSTTEQNLRLNPNDGLLTATDAALNPAGNVVAAAYTSNVAGATSTTLFDIDSAAGTLVRQGGAAGAPPSPNGGALTTIGSLGLGTNLAEAIGFDITLGNTAFASIVFAGSTRLFTINLTTGAATLAGTIGTGTTPYPGLTGMPARIRISSAPASVNEGGTATFQVTRSALPSGAVSVEYATAPGTATSGDDFTPTTGTLSWGAAESGPKTITVPVSADLATEGDETFSLTLSALNGANAALGAPSSTSVTIPANTGDPDPVVQFSSAGATVAEGGKATLTVDRVGSVTRPVSVTVATAPGTATDADYTPTSGLVTWEAGDGASKTVTVQVADDLLAEGDESFTVALSSPTGATIGSPSSFAVLVPANDGLVAPAVRPKVTLGGSARQRVATVRRRGVALALTADAACTLTATVRKGRTRIGRLQRSLPKGSTRVRVKIAKRHRKRLRAGQKLVVAATCSNAGGESTTRRRTIRLKR